MGGTLSSVFYGTVHHGVWSFQHRRIHPQVSKYRRPRRTEQACEAPRTLWAVTISAGKIGRRVPGAKRSVPQWCRFSPCPQKLSHPIFCYPSTEKLLSRLMTRHREKKDEFGIRSMLGSAQAAPYELDAGETSHVVSLASFAMNPSGRVAGLRADSCVVCDNLAAGDVPGRPTHRVLECWSAGEHLLRGFDLRRLSTSSATCRRLRQSLCQKHRVPGRGYKRFPRRYLHDTAGACRPRTLTNRQKVECPLFPFRKA